MTDKQKIEKRCEVCGRRYGGWHIFVRNIVGYSHLLSVLDLIKFQIKDTGEIVGGKGKQICGDCLEEKYGISVARKW